ncbi:unnamed protein product [Amoebophrya sp. A25]|nr:unnamed protein product [Amoebophrya sp. A25]|eukprot:GSA25T00013999001.1
MYCYVDQVQRIKNLMVDLDVVFLVFCSSSTIFRHNIFLFSVTTRAS